MSALEGRPLQVLREHETRPSREASAMTTHARKARANLGREALLTEEIVAA